MPGTNMISCNILGKVLPTSLSRPHDNHLNYPHVSVIIIVARLTVERSGPDSYNMISVETA